MIETKIPAAGEPMPELTIVEIAMRQGRDYVTPEDVQTALDGGSTVESVRMSVLAIIAKQLPIGMEDNSLCAFIAWRGMRRLKTGCCSTGH